MGLLSDYRHQAKAYDRTRAASPEILRALSAALSGAPGRRLADIGGGTGNYSLALAAEGWEPLVVDRSAEMLAQARSKGLETLWAEATDLPLPGSSVDGALLVSMLHHVERPVDAITEAGRVVAAGGTVAALVCTREDLEKMWMLELFPASAEWMLATHPPAAALLGALPAGRRQELILRDLSDASIAALANHPELVLQERYRRGTSYFERLGRDHPAQLADGLRRLERLCAEGGPGFAPAPTSLLVWQR